MTAPARSGTPSTRTRGAAAPRERELERTPERGSAGRGRSTAAERAYARRASRRQRLLSVVPMRMPGLASKTPFVLLVMGLLAVGVLATLFLSLSAVSDSYKLETAKNDVTDLSSKVEQLKSDVAKMESPEVLYGHAKQLGMVPAPDPVRIRQNPDGSVTVVGSATAATPPPPATTAPPASPPASSTTTPPASGGGH
jgi:outer membrane murein-binding lipoprotein Lpp